MKGGTLPSNGTWRRQTLTIITPPHMADTCTADTKDHKLPSYTGKRIGQSQHMKTTSLLFKWYNKRNPVRIWDKNNQTVYYGNEPHGISFAPQTTWQCKQHYTLLQSIKGSDLANSWNPSLKRPTHEWHEFGQAPKHLVLMCCYSMRFREKSLCVCVFHFLTLFQ